MRTRNGKSLEMIVPIEIEKKDQSIIKNVTRNVNEGNNSGEDRLQGNHLADTYSMEDLDKAIEPELDWLVEDLFARGHTVLLGGHEKSGKSYTGLALTCNASMGEPFLGHFKTKKSSVWYMALEDSDWRIKKRIKRELKIRYDPARIMFSQRIKAGPEALRMIRRVLEDKKIDILIIDTAARVDDPSRAQNYIAESSWYENFQDIAIDFNICVLLITHVTKSGNADTSNQFSTTRGMGGNTSIVDTLVQMRTEFQSPDAEMIITGRDVQSRAFLIHNTHTEPNTGILWQYVREIDSGMLGLTGSFKEVLNAIEEDPLTVEEICQVTGLLEKNAYKILNGLVKDGKVRKYPVEGQGNKRKYGIRKST
jgi:RecA-family ATPase